MRLFLLLLFLSADAYGQQWKEMLVTKQGDTLRPNDKIILVEGANYGFVYPKHHGEKMRMDAFRRYLQYNMTGDTFKIKRLSRIPITKTTFKGIAVIETYNSLVDRMNPIEYYVEVEDALTNKEIQIVK